ncbi:MAG: winged helix-turn-helix domain-containing protein [Euryarchaeota archaeon]|nr:winged helix-turn-helix domain-containing protein [Euryarchaeota archaeon]
MRTPLLDIVFRSEKRKNLLLYLLEGPKNIGDIKDALDVTSVGMLPQIKILKEIGLIIHEDDVYRLSPMGMVVSGQIQAPMKTFNVLESNYDYWLKRDLSGIPSDILDRLGEIGKYHLIEPDINHIFDPPVELKRGLPTAQVVRTLSSYFHPEYPSIFLGLAKKGVDIVMVITESIFERLKDEFRPTLDEFMRFENTELFVCKDGIDLAAVVSTDRFMMFSLFNKDGNYDHYSVISYDMNSLNWGVDLFEHYKKRSRRVTTV